MRQVVNRTDVEGRASAGPSPSPQPPHPRATHTLTRRIRFPISNSGMAGFATQRSGTMLDWCDLANCLGIVKQSMEKSVTGATLAVLLPKLTEVVRHGDAARCQRHHQM